MWGLFSLLKRGNVRAWVASPQALQSKGYRVAPLAAHGLGSSPRSDGGKDASAHDALEASLQAVNAL
jgi:hypothetical protein